MKKRLLINPIRNENRPETPSLQVRPYSAIYTSLYSSKQEGNDKMVEKNEINLC